MRLRSAAALTVLAILVVALSPALSLADSEATTSPATSLTFTSAVLHGVANPSSSDAAYAFQYGTSTSYTQTTSPTAISDTGAQNVSVPVGNLQPGTTYHFRLVVADNVGYSPTYHTGDDMTFTTPAPSATATTGNATSVTDTAATLNGIVNTTNPDSEWAFQYGTGTSYGQTTTPQAIGAGAAAVSVRLTGLQKNTTYHFRLVVAQGSYPTVYSAGGDATFTTNSKAFGVLRLRKTKLKIKHHRVNVKLKCGGASGAQCAGKLSITIPTGAGKNVRCLSTSFNVNAVKKFKLRRKVRKACRALVSSSKTHRRTATLVATYSGNQSRLKRTVVLFQ